jgi:hypothetical protein
MADFNKDTQHELFQEKINHLPEDFVLQIWSIKSHCNRNGSNFKYLKMA